MQISTEWGPAPAAWAEFTEVHPYLGFRPGTWQFHNFLRNHRERLQQSDAIRKAKGRFWIAHRERFPTVAFDCATGVLAVHGQGSAA